MDPDDRSGSHAGSTGPPGPKSDEASAYGQPLVGLDAIRRAAVTLAGVVMRTPVVALGGDPGTLLKAESLQAVGSFKIRGAYNAIAGLSTEERARGVVTYSSGNHGLGVARAARLLGARAVVVTPATASAAKLGRIAAEGAELIAVGPGTAERRQRAEDLARERGLTVIPPYDDDRVIAGQGTIGLELVEQVDDLAAVLIPIGGGGLSSGIAVAIHALRPNVRLVGVEPELAADARDSLAAGRIVEWPVETVARTMADGARTQALAPRTFAHLAALLDTIVTISEPEIGAAVRLAAEQAHLVVEPTGALSIAALHFRAAEAGLEGLTGSVVAIVSGGNVEPAQYRALLAGGSSGTTA